MILVLAGSRDQFHYWLSLRGKTRQEARFVHAPFDLDGYESGTKLVRFGTWYTRQDSGEIMDVATVLGFQVEDDHA